MNKKYTALILIALVAAAEANILSKLPANIASKLPADVVSKLPSPAVLEGKNWDGLGLEADVNDYVDNTLNMIIPFILEHGLDPMDLPDIEEGFEVRPFLITYSAWLRIHNGYMIGLVNMARNGDQMVNYFAKMLRIRVQIRVTDLEFVYRYLVQVMNIGPTGGIVGSLERFVVVVDLLFDFNNDEIHLQNFNLTDLGRLRVRLTGNILVDWLVNPVIGVFMRIFDTIIIHVVAANIRSALQSALVVINLGIRQIIDHIESFN